MSPLRHATDGRVHFSELSQHRFSAAHAFLAFEQTRKPSRPMIVGSIADDLVFRGGSNVAIYPGPTRRGKEWDAFQAGNAGKYLPIQSEYDEAKGAADALLASPVAREYLEGAEYQRVGQWEAYGLPCATGIDGQRGGFDILHVKPRGRAPFVADMKTTASTDPETFSRHAWKMMWHAQGAWLLDGARAMGLDVQDFYLIGVESSPPHNVTVLQVPTAILDMGRRSIVKWAERHRACEASGTWPQYVQSVVEMTVPPWVEEE